MNRLSPRDNLSKLMWDGNLAKLRDALTPESVNLLNESGLSLLHEAVGSLNNKATQLLLEHGAAVDSLDRRKMTALHYAASHRNLELTKLLLEAGADPNLQDEEGHTPLLAVLTQNLKDHGLVYLLLDHGADPWSDPWVEELLTQSDPSLLETIKARYPKPPEPRP
jgi:ankyrin repeat protein